MTQNTVSGCAIGIELVNVTGGFYTGMGIGKQNAADPTPGNILGFRVKGGAQIGMQSLGQVNNFSGNATALELDGTSNFSLFNATFSSPVVNGQNFGGLVIPDPEATIVIKGGTSGAFMDQASLLASGAKSILVKSGSQSCTFQYCTFQSTVQDAIAVEGEGISGVTVKGCKFFGTTHAGISALGTGTGITGLNVIQNEFGSAYLFGSPPFGNYPTGPVSWTNYVGYSTKVPTGGSGIILEGAISQSTIGHFPVLNSGNSPANANVIVFQGGDGIEIREGVTDVKVGRNFISSNAGLPVNLRPAGEAASLVTANDAGDADAGPNDLLNSPVLVSAVANGSTLTYVCNYDGQPSTTLSLDFYAVNTVGGPLFYYGSDSITTDASGHASKTKTFNETNQSSFVHVVARLDNGKVSEASNSINTVPIITTAGQIRFAASTYQFSEKVISGYTRQVVVERVNGSTGPVQATLTFVPGTATSSDFPGGSPLGTTSILTFADGQTSAVIPISILEDNVAEGNESFSLQISTTPANLASYPNTQVTAPSTTVVTVTETPPSGYITFPAATQRVAERIGNAFSIQRVGGSLGRVQATLSYALTGTANVGDFISGRPFQTISPTISVVFEDGQTSVPVALRMLLDTVIEPDETFQLILEVTSSDAGISPNSALGAFASTQVIIVDDDDVSNCHFDQVAYNGTEAAAGANVSFHITRSYNADMPQSIQVAPLLSEYNADFVTALQTVDFVAGETDKTVVMQVVDDALVEPTETVNLRISNLAGLVGTTPAYASLTVVDNDGVNISLGDVSVLEGTSATPATVTLPIAFSAATPIPFNLEASIVGGTANASDVSLASSTVSIAAGATSAVVSITVQRDSVAEADETLVVRLALPSGAPAYLNLIDAEGTLTLLDDDDVSNIVFDQVSYTASETAASSVVTMHLVRSSKLQTAQTFLVVATTNTADLQTSSKTVQFAAGESDKVVTFQTYDDSLLEGTETAIMEIRNVGGLPASPSATASIVITDNDTLNISLGDLSSSEGTASTAKTVALPVVLNRAPSSNLSLNVEIVGGTADSSDGGLISGVVNISAGSTSGVVSLTIQRDSIVESNETMLVRLSLPLDAPTYINLVDPDGTLTITDDDLAVFTVTVPSITETDAGATEAILTINSSAASQTAMSVNYSTMAGTALVDSDFSAAAGQLIFAPGETSKTVSVPILGDLLVEPTESFTFALSSVVGGTLPGTGNYTITILDNDARSVTFSAPSVNEGNSGSRSLTFTASIDSATGSDISFAWATSSTGVTSTGGSDYVVNSGNVTIPAGQLSASFSVSILGDVLHEQTEQVRINISGFTNSTNFSATAFGSILNDDAAPTISVADTVVTRGQGAQFKAWFKLSVTGQTSLTTAVNYQTSNATARSGIDYEATSGTVTLTPGQVSQWIGVPILAGSKGNAMVKFNLNLSNPGNATISDSTGVASIVHMEVTEFIPLGNHLFVIKFPSGFGQNYLVESTSLLGSGWTPNSSILIGSGFTITQVLYCEDPKCFFRVVATEGAPPSN